MEIELMVENGGIYYLLAPEEGMTLTLERKGTPGTLKFTVVKDNVMNFTEGNSVNLKVDGVTMFNGFVMTKGRDKGGTIDVTAYDQLFYFKFKENLYEENIKASALFGKLAGDHNIKIGEIEDTGYVIDIVDEDDTTLFDIIQNALDETLTATKTLYVLYDEGGKLYLKSIGNLKLDLLIDEETGENYSYESSIAERTYNRIKLTYDNEDTNKKEVYLVQDSESMNRWGVLQRHETLNSPEGAADKAEALLAMYNQKTRKLSISNAFGDNRVRAGSLLVVSLNLGDMAVVQKYMMAEKVTHKFDQNNHLMDLTLVGGEFIV